MQRLLAALPSLIIFGAVLCVVSIAVITGLRQRRQDRRRILAEGTSAEAVIAEVIADARSERCRVRFRFQPDGVGPPLEATQKSTVGALQSLGLGEGSSVRVYYLPKWPRYAFIKALAVAERVDAIKAPAGLQASESQLPSVYFIAYVGPGAAQVTNALRWTGSGDISIGATVVRFTAKRARPFWIPKNVQQEFPRDAITNVEVSDNAVRCEISGPYKKPKALQFWAVNAEEAKAIGAQLPDSKTATFVPQLAERTAFNARLREVTPRTPVTPIIIGINVALFVIAAVLGGGVLVPNGEVMIKLGSDFTPLTAGGEWWRLLTSIFLHFGILHLSFNMWALWINGVLAERLYGGTRYLTLYLVAGVAGSITSFLWHPFVNGAGASGAIFGVLGALFAYFLRTDSGIPQSVLKTQRKTAGLFIVVSLLNAARVRGIDNAAHLGGVVAGFVMGWLLCRPLDVKRDEQDWTGQWVRAVAVIVASVLFVGIQLSSGKWHPRVLYDASGRPVLFAELATPPHTFGGVTLGMTSQELLRAKGKPIKKESNGWFYDSLDSAHDGVLDVRLTEGTEGHPAAVWAVLYYGEPNAEPPGIANLLAFTRQDLLMRYGTPRSENGDEDSKYLFFGNGLMVRLDADKVRGYGVYVPQR